MSTFARSILAGALAFFMLFIGANAAHAVSFTFASFTWDQDETPDTAALLGNGQILGGATFSANFPNTSVGDVGFPDVPAGAANHAASPFNTSLTTARITGIATTANTSRALNLPRLNNGSVTRHGVQLGWVGAGSIANGTDDDLVFYESASSGAAPENPMLRVRLAGTSTYSDWYYFAPDAFQLYHGNLTEGAFATGVDLSDLGLANGALIDQIQLANLVSADRISGSVTHSSGGQDFGVGQVVFDGSTTIKPDAGAFASFRNDGYGTSTLDPDVLYLADLQAQVIPEPGSVALAAFALAAMSRIRRRRTA